MPCTGFSLIAYLSVPLCTLNPSQSFTFPYMPCTFMPSLPSPHHFLSAGWFSSLFSSWLSPSTLHSWAQVPPSHRFSSIPTFNDFIIHLRNQTWIHAVSIKRNRTGAVQASFKSKTVVDSFSIALNAAALPSAQSSVFIELNTSKDCAFLLV